MGGEAAPLTAQWPEQTVVGRQAMQVAVGLATVTPAPPLTPRHCPSSDRYHQSRTRSTEMGMAEQESALVAAEMEMAEAETAEAEKAAAETVVETVPQP